MRIILNYTAFGRAVYAIGDEAASGINIEKVTVKVFVTARRACRVHRLIRLKFGQASLGDDQMFPVITALVVGGRPWAGAGAVLCRPLLAS